VITSITTVMKALAKEQCILNTRNLSFSQRTLTELNIIICWMCGC